MDNLLDADLLQLEKELAALVPSAPSRELISRIDEELDLAIVAASTEVHDAELSDLENHLGLLSPAGMSGEVLSRMTQAMDRWHEHIPLAEKLVPFEPTGEPAVDIPEQAQEAKRFHPYAAVAAVVVMGVLTALAVPKFNKETPITAEVVNLMTEDEQQKLTEVSSFSKRGGARDVVVSSLPHDTWLVPDSLNQDVTHTRDVGIIMMNDNVPHRSIRIDYMDRVKVLDQEGREIEINRPGVQYMLIPVEVN